MPTTVFTYSAFSPVQPDNNVDWGVLGLLATIPLMRCVSGHVTWWTLTTSMVNSGIDGYVTCGWWLLTVGWFSLGVVCWHKLMEPIRAYVYLSIFKHPPRGTYQGFAAPSDSLLHCDGCRRTPTMTLLSIFVLTGAKHNCRWSCSLLRAGWELCHTVFCRCTREDVHLDRGRIGGGPKSLPTHHNGCAGHSVPQVSWMLKLWSTHDFKLGCAFSECDGECPHLIAVPEGFIPRVWSNGRAPWTSSDVTCRFGYQDRCWEASPIPELHTIEMHNQPFCWNWNVLWPRGDGITPSYGTARGHRKRALRRLRRMIVLRGHAYYRGVRYVSDDIIGLHGDC